MLDHIAQSRRICTGTAPLPVSVARLDDHDGSGDLAPFDEHDLDGARSRLSRLAQLWRLRLAQAASRRAGPC